MVKPEFRPFNFNIFNTNFFTVISDRGELIDFSGSAMTTGYDFIKKDWLLSPVSRLVFNNPYTEELSKKLKEKSGFEKIAYSTSGTEACDVILSRYNRPIYSLEGAYHGLSYLTRIVSNGKGIDIENKIIHLKPPDSILSLNEALEYNEKLLKSKEIPNKGGTLVFELIQSDGGVNVLPEDFIKYLVEIAHDRELKIIVDEVYTGYGRSGELFYFKKFGLEPDAVCLGKGMAAGLPLGAILYREDWDLPYNEVVSMQAANMFTSRVALEVLNALNEETLQRVRTRGKNILELLKSIKNEKIFSVRGRGFMIGVEFRNDDMKPESDYALKVRNILAEKGVVCTLTGEYNNVLKITPPVLIDDDTLEKGVSIIQDVLNKN